MATYSDVARMLARLEERAAALDPAPPCVVWLRDRAADSVENPRTGEVLAGDEFERRYPGVVGFTLDLHHAGGDWEPPAAWGAQTELEMEEPRR